MELVVISGKGGTGKTTIAAALAELVHDVVRVDCDVDAPNFYLYYQTEDIEKDVFYGMKLAEIDAERCQQCGQCAEACVFDAIHDFKVNPYQCEGCGACVLVCPFDAIKFEEEKGADTFITKSNKGIISRAQMVIGAEGSGKLITKLRNDVTKYVNEQDLVISDGSPGIGCAVISSLTGSDVALLVVEPTKSGYEDFVRVAQLCKFFNLPTLVCINKSDLNANMTQEIHAYSNQEGLTVVGEIPYDEIVPVSINELKPITNYKNSVANQAIRAMWQQIKGYLNLEGAK